MCLDYESSNSQSTTSKRNQTIFKDLSIKSKLRIVLETQRNTFNELTKQFASLKHNIYRNQASLEYLNFYILCEHFLNKGFSNFLKLRSNLTLNIPDEHSYSYKAKQFALVLHFAGPIVYTFFQKSLGLPSPKALKLSTKNWEINPGFNDFLFQVLALKANTMKSKSKQCVICVGEMSVKSFLFYNFVKDEIVGFQSRDLFNCCDISKLVTVVMIHGLHDSWKQPIGYFFSNTSCTECNLKNILFHCIKQLDSISFNVKVMISSLKKNSHLFADQLCITPETPYFTVGSKEIVYMFDPLHLIKTTRNHFFNYRFKINKKIISKIYLTKFYTYDKCRQYKFAPKLTDIHMNPNPLQRKEIIYAAQVFSNTVVAGMTALVYYDELCPSAYDTIDFIGFMDKLFDIFNSSPVSVETFNEQISNHYHLPFTNSILQKQFLQSMFKYFTDLKIQNFNLEKRKWINVSRKFNIQFVNSWLISIAALIRLHFNVSNETQCNIEIYTCKLNRECLDNFLRTVKTIKGNCIKPTCNQFKYNFKKLFRANYFEYTKGAHCLKHLDDIVTDLNEISIEVIKTIFPENNRIETLPIENISNYRFLDLSKQNAIGCICFYLIGQCLKVHQCETCLIFAKSQFNINLPNERFHSFFDDEYYKNVSLLFGNLIANNSIFYQYILQFDLTFNKHFNSLAPYPNVGKNLRDFLLNSIFFYHPCKNFPKDILINLFIRLRIYNNLHTTNKNNNRQNKKIKIS